MLRGSTPKSRRSLHSTASSLPLGKHPTPCTRVLQLLVSLEPRSTRYGSCADTFLISSSFASSKCQIVAPFALPLSEVTLCRPNACSDRVAATTMLHRGQPASHHHVDRHAHQPPNPLSVCSRQMPQFPCCTAIGSLLALRVGTDLVSIPYLPSSLYFSSMRPCRLRSSLASAPLRHLSEAY